MTLHFYVRFSSAWGQRLWFAFAGETPLPMEYYNEQFWRITVHRSGVTLPEYRYILQQENGLMLPERNARTLAPAPGEQELTVRDIWIWPGEAEHAWLTAPFRDVFFVRPVEAEAGEGNYGFRVYVPLLPASASVWLLGSIPELGGWETEKAIRMPFREDGSFGVALQLPAGVEVSYKYLLREGDNFVFEDGENRRLFTGEFSLRGHVLIRDGFVRFRRKPWRGAGVAVPVFSLRSEGGLGVGEFEDIRLLADWAAMTGQRILQLLPVNDTSLHYNWTDSYPYAAVSAYALHPIYIHLPKLGKARGYKIRQQALNELPALDYEQVIRFKISALKSFYKKYQPDAAYEAWVTANAFWLEPYATFRCSRDTSTTPGFHYYVQYQLHCQLQEAVAYAHARGIAVKGDLPIGVSLESADVNETPELFHLDVQAGAPPDDFACSGQNWGFPTYNWTQMEEKGYDWWKRRLAHMSQYFSAFRIDHVLGFFRIWQIPRYAKEGVMGHLEPSIPLTEEEIQAYGITFTRSRYCNPYITDTWIDDIFGETASDVKAEYLEPSPQGLYQLLPAYNTQEKIAAAVADERTRKGLYELSAGVLFLEPSPGKFHPRYGMERTPAFAALDTATQQRLRRLADEFFYRRHDALWEKEALRKLPVLQQATNMLICGEDLGMVPRCVPGVLRGLGILSLEIQHMPKQADYALEKVPYLSVVTPSTHDMSTLREWWKNDIETIVSRHLQSPAMWSIFQLQDWLALDDTLPHLPPSEERINIPAFTPWYWKYRMPLTLEDLMEAGTINCRILRLVRESGRS